MVFSKQSLSAKPGRRQSEKGFNVLSFTVGRSFNSSVVHCYHGFFQEEVETGEVAASLAAVTAVEDRLSGLDWIFTLKDEQSKDTEGFSSSKRCFT